MKVNLGCGNCGSTNLRVRTSEKVGLLVVNSIVYCNNCGTEHHTMSQHIKVRTPVYHDRPEALRINKPLLQADTATPDLFNGVLGQEEAK
ncbi:hypothetical protein QJU83_02320 [Pasteurella skyensis]|uniref:hypothetical protein n=1 Tax=Phocoenobacter skyensis TaxID=97481 RepID=UPI00274F5189|nr:hypothetical protein [Pasteurella skyensis]MDP8176378.1 hypothetical protein [Pasteurella skyensis]MDP8199109.1 hypothetical protein [Pasteurella skyensis]